MERAISIFGGFTLAVWAYFPSVQDVTCTLVLGVVGGVGGWLAHAVIKYFSKRKKAGR